MRTAAEWTKDFEAPSASVLTILARHIPARLAEHLMIEIGIPDDRRTSSLKRSERLALIDALTGYPLPWSGNEGYKKAEVTGGGVALDEVDPKTLESKRVPGCIFVAKCSMPSGRSAATTSHGPGPPAALRASQPARRS